MSVYSKAVWAILLSTSTMQLPAFAQSYDDGARHRGLRDNACSAAGGAIQASAGRMKNVAEQMLNNHQSMNLSAGMAEVQAFPNLLRQQARVCLTPQQFATCAVHLDRYENMMRTMTLETAVVAGEFGAASYGLSANVQQIVSAVGSACTPKAPVIDINHNVRLFAQPTSMTCWSAAATMILGTNMSVGPGQAQLVQGGLGSQFENVEEFARAHGLRFHAPQSWTLKGLASLLERGPLWVAGRVPSGHAFVIGAMKGDGTAEGTELTIYDPWPPGVGKIVEISYLQFMQLHPMATMYVLQR